MILLLIAFNDTRRGLRSGSRARAGLMALTSSPHQKSRPRFQNPRDDTFHASTFSGADGSTSLEFLFLDRLEAGKHHFGFGNRLERHAIADREEFIPHRENTRVLVRLF